MTEVGDDIVVEVVAWRWSMLSWLDLWNVIELLSVVLSLGDGRKNRNDSISLIIMPIESCHLKLNCE